MGEITASNANRDKMYAQAKKMGAKGADWAGIITDETKKSGVQSLIVEKNGVLYALDGKHSEKLESKDIETAKAEVRSKIKSGSLSSLAILDLNQIAKKKMQTVQDGENPDKTPKTDNSNDNKPVDGAESKAPTAEQTAVADADKKNSIKEVADLIAKNDPSIKTIGSGDKTFKVREETSGDKKQVRLTDQLGNKIVFANNDKDRAEGIKTALENGFGTDQYKAPAATAEQIAAAKAQQKKILVAKYQELLVAQPNSFRTIKIGDNQEAKVFVGQLDEKNYVALDANGNAFPINKESTPTKFTPEDETNLETAKKAGFGATTAAPEPTQTPAATPTTTPSPAPTATPAVPDNKSSSSSNVPEGEEKLDNKENTETAIPPETGT